MSKDIDVARGGMPVAVHLVSYVHRAHERQELPWNDPVQVAVFNFLIMFILTCIKSLEIVPSELSCFLKTLKTVDNLAVVKAIASACIPVVSQFGLVHVELFEGVLSVNFENNDHESAHQKG